MIISDENPETTSSPTVKSAALPSASGVSRRESSLGPAPPSYNAATSMSSDTPRSPLSPVSPYGDQQYGDQPYSNQPYTNPSQPLLNPSQLQRVRPTQVTGYEEHLNQAREEEHQRQIRSRTNRRFLESFCVALLAYILLVCFLGLWSLRLYTNPPWIDNTKPLPPGLPGKKLPWPISSDGDIIVCIGEGGWSQDPPPFYTSKPYMVPDSLEDPKSDAPYVYYTTIGLPLDVFDHNLFSRGRHASGSVVLRTMESEEHSHRVIVNIQASYQYKNALLWTNICALRKENSRSIGIYTSTDFDGTKDIRFFVDVIFPKRVSSSSTEPRLMGNFTGSLSWFDYTIDTLQDIAFDKLTLATERDKVRSIGVLANSLAVTTTNGAINGSYNVTNDATFTTSNAPIEVDLNLIHEEDKGSKGSIATLSTSNGHVVAKNALYHLVNGTEAEGGRFDFVISTKNAPVDVSFSEAPVDSVLDVTVSTSNGGTDVHLHPTYEGSVSLVTTNGITAVHPTPNVEDPSGRERPRVVQWDHRFKLWWLGWVGWGEKKKYGDLTVRTSNGANTLYL